MSERTAVTLMVIIFVGICILGVFYSGVIEGISGKIAAALRQ